MNDRQATSVFAATAVLLLLLMAAQVQREDGQSALRHLTRTLTAPFIGGVSSGARGVGSLWDGYVDLVGVRKERDALARRVGRLEAERARLAEIYRENRRLRELLELRTEAFPTGLVARVRSFVSSGPLRRAVVLDRGRRDGVGPGWVAIHEGAVVGRVVAASGGLSELLLVSDPDSGVAVRAQGTRYAGILRGGNRGPARLAPLEYVPRDAEVTIGDPLVTSGLDQLFPPGLLVGHVRALEARSPLTWDIEVELAFDARRLEELLLIPPSTPQPDEDAP